jgi:proteasome lid subunit RPN8/RPN11
MSADYDIQIYRGTERDFHGNWPFLSLVRESLTALLGWDFGDSQLFVRVYAMSEDMFGPPPDTFVENLIPEYGYADVYVYQGRRLIYEQPHLISEIVTNTLAQKLLNEFPEETCWAFRIDIPGMPAVSSMRETPTIEGGMLVDLSTSIAPAFTIRRIAEPELPLRRLSDYPGFSLVGQGEGHVTTVMSHELFRDIISRPYSAQTEDGGFLAGTAFRDAEREGCYIVEVTAAVPAQHSGASVMHFVFTGDSFAEFKHLLRTERQDDRIVGWYHTHLFPATESFGLSSFDVRMHSCTFTIPWQVAALVNVDNDRRVLRYYAPSNAGMSLCPYGIHA